MILLSFLIALTIADIDVEVQYTNPQLIIDASGLQIGSELESGDIQEALISLNRLRLFNAVAIDTTIVSDGIFLTIIVDEAPYLDKIPQISGNSKIRSSDIQKKINLRIGQVLTDRTIFQAKRDILDLYKEKSFYATSVQESLLVDSLHKATLYLIIDEGSEPRIGTIEITGNEMFSDETIEKLMQNKPKAFLRKGKLDEVKLEEDIEKIKAFYKEKGYLDVSVGNPVIEVVDNDFVITLQVEENKQYFVGDISFAGNELFGTRYLENMLLVRTGKVYNQAKVNESLNNIIGVYADEGYIYASIIPNETVRDTIIDIEYVINEAVPASVNRVIITGNHTTRENVIRREIRTMPGERFRRSDVIRSARELFNLGFFEDIVPTPGTPDDSGNIDLIYQMKEKEGVASIGGGVSYSGLDRLTGYFELSHPNIFGRGQRLYTKFEIGGRLTSFQIGVTEPRLSDTRTSVGFDVYYTNRYWDYYTKRDFGVAGRVSLPFYLDYARFGYVLRMERSHVFDISSSYVPPETGYNLYNDTIPKWTLSHLFSLVRDSRDYIFNPSAGTYLALRAEVAAKILFANVDYSRLTFDARVYFPLLWKFVLMARMKTGIVTSHDEVPYYKQFYVGGVGENGVRGYPDRSLTPQEGGEYIGGTAMFINNLEFKLKASQGLAFLLFYDQGKAFASHRDVNLHDLARSVGGGVRIEIPMMGLVGFDMGYGFDRAQPGWEAHFQINPLGIF